MRSTTPSTNGLPANAYKELAPGEVYVPVMRPDGSYAEVTPWSVLLGLLMSLIFSAAAAYSGLKIGQVFEAAIPIAILAVGISAAMKKSEALGQNVIIQSIGSASGAVVAGAIFTIPALYILDLPASFFQVFLASLFGGILGILFLIPFRKFFVKDMHGKFPFPEATATTEILIAGEKGGRQAVVLVVSGLIGGVYDFLVTSVGAWAEVISTRLIPAGAVLADKVKMVFKVNVLAMIFGLGYIIGLKYAAIICAGSFLSYFVFIPLFYELGQHVAVPLGAGVTNVIGAMSAEEIFRTYVRHIGIGGIAMAGIVGIIRSSKIIRDAVKLAYNEIFRRTKNAETSERTQTDLTMLFIVTAILLTAVMIFVFLYIGVTFNALHAVVGLALILIIAFLFTTVAANAIAIVGTNPVSGMTLMTLILSSFVLVSVGLSGTAGMVSGLIIGGIVCTALSMAGSFITDLKIGYWLGSTPRKQEAWKFLGTLVASATVGIVIYILNDTFGFKGETALAAPQANAMAAVIQPLMSKADVPWILYAVGAVISLIMTGLGVSPLAFALGMYLPIELNTPLLLGGLVAWFVSTRTKDEKINSLRSSRGTLIASGLIAGGSLFGVVGAVLRFFDVDLLQAHWQESYNGELLAVVMFVVLIAYTLWDSLRAKDE